MVLVKNLKFCERFVLCKIHPEKVFGDVLVRKQAFLDNINMDLMLVISSLTQTMLIEREQSPKIESGVWEGDKARNQ